MKIRGAFPLRKDTDGQREKGRVTVQGIVDKWSTNENRDKEGQIVSYTMLFILQEAKFISGNKSLFDRLPKKGVPIEMTDSRRHVNLEDQRVDVSGETYDDDGYFTVDEIDIPTFGIHVDNSLSPMAKAIGVIVLVLGLVFIAFWSFVMFQRG